MRNQEYETQSMPVEEPPPRGIQPEKIWREGRMWDLIGAINRYKEARRKIPNDWLIELEVRLVEFNSGRPKTRDVETDITV